MEKMKPVDTLQSMSLSQLFDFTSTKKLSLYIQTLYMCVCVCVCVFVWASIYTLFFSIMKLFVQISNEDRWKRCLNSFTI